MGLVHVEQIEDVLGMDAVTWARAITDYVFDSLEKENKDMNTATSNNGTTFKVGDGVKHTQTTERGVIESLYAHIKLNPEKPGETRYVSIPLNHLTHYDGPTSEEDAWERVTMDIAAGVHELLSAQSYPSIYEVDRERMRHEAYKVLGCVMNCNENHAALRDKLNGKIERAVKRFTDRN